MDILFWQSIVEITQIPQNLVEINAKGISWLGDPFNDQRVYATKFLFGIKGFSWKFIMNSKSKKNAVRAGYGLLSYLKELYPGLNGTVRVKQINHSHLNKEHPYLQELILPSPPYVNNELPLIQKIVNFAEFNKEHDMKVYIFWQFNDQETTSTFRDPTKSTLRYKFYYNLRIFIDPRPIIEEGTKVDTQLAELSGYIDYLTSDIRNINLQRAITRDADISPQNLWTMVNLFDKPICLDSCIFDRDTQSFTQKLRVIDFNIPPKMDLDRAIPTYNYRFSRIPKKDGLPIYLGYVYNRDGILTKDVASLNVSDLTKHMFISGNSGAGKSMFEAFLSNEIQMKGKNIGTMIINLKKVGEEDLFKTDIVLKKGDLNFRAPYIIMTKDLEIVCKQAAEYIVASLGLKNVVVDIMYRILYEECLKDGSPPDDLIVCFEKVLEWLKKRPYPTKFQGSVIRAIENRVMSLLSSPFIRNVIKLGPIPQWFIEWTQGKSVFIDLSKFHDDEKRLLTLAIFQMITSLLAEDRSNKLKYVIFLDEISTILREPSYQEYSDNETIKQHILEKVFNTVLSSFRSRGVGLITATQLPISLFEDVYKQPSLKVIFRTEKDYIKVITNNPQEQDDLINQEDRRALVLDGVHGRKFAIYTMDFSYHRNFFQKGEIICPHCNADVPNNLKFCNSCGTIIDS